MGPRKLINIHPQNFNALNDEVSILVFWLSYKIQFFIFTRFSFYSNFIYLLLHESVEMCSFLNKYKVEVQYDYTELLSESQKFLN